MSIAVPIEVPRQFQQIFGSRADGPQWVLGPHGPVPVPVGPGPFDYANGLAAFQAVLVEAYTRGARQILVPARQDGPGSFHLTHEHVDGGPQAVKRKTERRSSAGALTTRTSGGGRRARASRGRSGR